MAIMVLSLMAALLWWSLLLLPCRPWSRRPFFDADPEAGHGPLADVTALIPARNEAALIETTLRALAAQGVAGVVLVDDQSSDATAQRARQALAEGLTVVTGTPPPPGWSGKLWALEQGRQKIVTPLTLLLDADVELAPGLVAALREKLRRERLDLASLLAAPRMIGFWEKLLMPAFVYFFKLLYPFRLANSPSSPVAAAAGGCVLLETRLLAAIGGFGAIRDALIDDCALARRVKSLGYRTWIGLTHCARSQRPAPALGLIWNMVARTAFTQLRCSPWLLGLCTGVMLLAFWVPPAGLAHPDPTVRMIALAAVLAMLASYLPLLAFYGRSSAWAPLLPLVATLYLGMTWSSAIRCWRGERARWKDRRYGATLLLLALPLAWPAAASDEPAAVVEGFQSALIEVMQEADSLGYGGRYQRLEPVIERSHDLPAITRLVTGRHWDKLSEAERRALLDTFGELIVATYAHRFDGYAGERFETVAVERTDQGSALVHSLFTDSDGETIRFDYLLQPTDAGWRIVNIIVDGVSDLALKRAEYTSILGREGFEALLARLKEKIAEYSKTGSQ